MFRILLIHHLFRVLINLCGTIVVVGDYFKVMILCQTLRLADDNISQLQSEVVFFVVVVSWGVVKN